jgi:hypothetical protein
MQPEENIKIILNLANQVTPVTNQGLLGLGNLAAE